jgi:glutathione S-transferase
LTHTLPELDKQLASGGWLAGDFFSFADIDLLVGIEFMAWVKQSVPEECTNLHDWYRRAKAELG